MAVVTLLVLVFIDTFISGYLLASRRADRKRYEALTVYMQDIVTRMDALEVSHV